MTSVKLGDVETVKLLVKRKCVSVDTTYKGASLLCLAVSRCDVAMTRVLCDAGADVNTCYTWQGATETPLIAAVRLGYEQIVATLLQAYGVDVNIRDSQGKSGNNAPGFSFRETYCHFFDT